MLPVFSYFLFGFSEEQNTGSSVSVSQDKCNKEGFWAQVLKWKSQTTRGRIRMGVETKARNPPWKGQSCCSWSLVCLSSPLDISLEELKILEVLSFVLMKKTAIPNRIS